MEGNRRRRMLLYGLIAAVVILVVAVVILLASGGGDDSAKPAATTSTSSASTSSSTRASTSSTSISSSSTSPASTATTAGGPMITSFTNDPPNCTTNMVHLHWATQNASGITITIDESGVPLGDATNGDALFPFVCGEPHTYLLTALTNEGGGTAQRQITVQSP